MLFQVATSLLSRPRIIAARTASCRFSRITAWVTTKGEKMSKSLGNVLSVGALTEEYPAVAVRWALSTVHHRSAIEWGAETLPAAHE